MKLLTLWQRVQVAEDIDSENLAPVVGKGVQDVNSVKATSDLSRLKYDPDMQDSKSTMHNQRADVLKDTINALNNLELFLVRSDDSADSQLRDEASQLRKSISSKIKKSIPLAAMTGPLDGGTVTSIGGVAS